jgi:hypothetical protein
MVHIYIHGKGLSVNCWYLRAVLDCITWTEYVHNETEKSFFENKMSEDGARVGTQTHTRVLISQT